MIISDRSQELVRGQLKEERGFGSLGKQKLSGNHHGPAKSEHQLGFAELC